MSHTLTNPHPVYSTVTLHPRRRRARWIVATVVIVALAAAGSFLLYERHIDDTRRDYIAADGWPTNGQAAVQVGDAAPEASPDAQPAPIASMAKVMTAYLVLKTHPLDDGDDGFTLDISDDDVALTQRQRDRDESVVAVAAGETLTQRQALLALLLPSANNVAVFLARRVAGRTEQFVRWMNHAARSLGMRHTHYADPSGYDAATVSTAADQVILARAAARDETFSRLVATRSAMLPVAGTVHNTDTLLGHDGIVGTKTGSHDAAGGCFMFRARRTVDGRPVDVYGVVMGQRGHNLVDAGLYAARQLLESVA
jgi:D-alanyl-D-alanine carboxypeptidase (penicillin-binding protein 5/6)